MGCVSSSLVVEPQGTETQYVRKSRLPDVTYAAQQASSESPRVNSPTEPLGRLASRIVNDVCASPGPHHCRERRISQGLTHLCIVDNKGRLSVEFSRDLRESFSDARVSASLAEAGSQHVLIYGNDGSPPLLMKRLVGKGGEKEGRGRLSDFSSSYLPSLKFTPQVHTLAHSYNLSSFSCSFQLPQRLWQRICWGMGWPRGGCQGGSCQGETGCDGHTGQGAG